MEKIKIGSNIKLIYDLSELTENARKEIDTVKCYLSTSNGASEYNLDLCGDVQTSFNPIENINYELELGSESTTVIGDLSNVYRLISIVGKFDEGSNTVMSAEFPYDQQRYKGDYKLILKVELRPSIGQDYRTNVYVINKGTVFNLDSVNYTQEGDITIYVNDVPFSDNTNINCTTASITNLTSTTVNASSAAITTVTSTDTHTGTITATTGTVGTLNGTTVNVTGTATLPTVHSTDITNTNKVTTKDIDVTGVSNMDTLNVKDIVISGTSNIEKPKDYSISAVTLTGDTLTIDQSNATSKSINLSKYNSTEYVLPTASEVVTGGIKTGYTETNRNFAVKLDNTNKAYVTVPGEDNIVKFKEYVFVRSNTQPSTPIGGTYTSPIPIGWYDNVPTGSDLVWMSTKTFYSDGIGESDWSNPQLLADSASIDVCYSAQLLKPNVPTTHGTQNDAIWHNVGTENDIWMATSTKNNLQWSDWSVVKIKGENGTNGNSIQMVGRYNDTDNDLSSTNQIVSGIDYNNVVYNKPDHILQTGDCLNIINGTLNNHLMYLSDINPKTWVDLGLIGGDSCYFHVKYSDDMTTFTSNNGKNVGKYIGTYTDNNKIDSITFSDYTWSLFQGTDGAGYWFFYTVTNSATAPVSPGIDYTSKVYREATNFTDSSTNIVWNDNPVASLTYGQYQWMIWMRDAYDSLSWSAAKLWNRGVKDGVSNYTYIAYSTSADGSQNFSTSYFADAVYIGLCTSNSSTQPTVNTSYTWSRLKGEQGLQGCTLRNRGEYNATATYINQQNYVPQTTIENRYIDYVFYNISDTLQSHYYMVNPNQTHTGDYISITGIAPTTENVGTDKAWVLATETNFEYIKYLVANVIDASEISANEIVVKRDQTIVAGITQGDSTQTAANNAIMWAGTATSSTSNYTDIKNSPFVVYEDGHVKASNIEINGTGSFTGNITATNGQFSGTVNATSGNIKNVTVSKFTSSWDLPDGLNLDEYDNTLVMVPQNTGDHLLPIGVENAGRIITILNSESQDLSTNVSGQAVIGISNGFFIYEYGVRKKKLYVSNEIVRLIGYGNSTTFYGWIVISRMDVLTNGLYGNSKKVLVEGMTLGSTENDPTYNVPIESHYFTNTFNETPTKEITIPPMVCNRTSKGVYKVTIPSSLAGRLGNSEYMVLLTATGISYQNDLPVNATLLYVNNTNFTVAITDSNGYCDGGFYYQLFSTKDWSLANS